MHIVLALLGTIVTILVLLNRLAEAGIDLGGLNPFTWSRRRKWKKMYQGNPIYQFTDPMEVTSILMVAVAKIDGDLSSEEKKKIKQLYEEEFKLSRREATELMVSSAHILGDGTELKENLKKVIAPSLDKYTKEQVEATFQLLNQVASIGGEIGDSQKEIIDSVHTEMSKIMSPDPKWGHN